MRLYLSKNNNRLNGQDLKTETLTRHLCLNPRYRVRLDREDTAVLLDSGGFQDRKDDTRVSFDEALARQLAYEKKVGFTSHRLVAYDLMGDAAVTVEANRFIADRRSDLAPRQLVMMVQGETVDDYIECLKQTLEFATPEDCIGIGGVALAGRHNAVRTKLKSILFHATPLVVAAGLRDIHLFGVGAFSVLRESGFIVKMSGGQEVNLSTDTSAYEVMSTMGSVVNLVEEKWDKVYTKEQKMVDYHPAHLTYINMLSALAIVSKY